MLDTIVFAIKTLKRKGVRTLLTVSGIAVGVASVILIGSIGETGTSRVNAELDSLGISGLSISTVLQNDEAELCNADLDIIKSLPCVESAMPIVTNMTTVTYREKSIKTILWGIDSGSKSVISIDVLYGREFSRGDISGCASVCMMDSNIAEQLFKRTNVVGKHLSIAVGGITESYKIIGIAKADSGILQSLSGDYIPSFIYLPYTTLQRFSGESEISQIAVKINENEDMDTAANLIKGILNQSKGITDGIRTDNLARQRDKLSRMLEIVSLVLTAIAGISLVVAGLGITTVMLVSVNERTREIGIKKSIGASNCKILLEFLIEALAISITGSLLGAMVGLVLSMAAAKMVGVTVMIPFKGLMISIISAILTGVVFGVYPARKASRLKPVDALRQE